MKNDEKTPTGLLHSADELRKLIVTNPTLPIIVFAGEDSNCGDYSYMSCSYIKAYKGEYLDCMQRVKDYMCFTDRDEFREAIEESFADCGELSEEEWNALVEKALAKYEPYWKSCIILYVDN